MQTYNNCAQDTYPFESSPVFAGFWVRLAAYLIDLVIAAALQTALRLVLFLSFSFFWEKNPLDYTFLFQYTWKDALLYAVGISYFVLCTYYCGATLGKRALNLQVIGKDGEAPSFLDILYRETIGRFLAAFVLGIGYIAAGLTREKTGLHDVLADTRVVYARKIPAYEAYVRREGGRREAARGAAAAANDQPQDSGQEQTGRQPSAEDRPTQLSGIEERIRPELPNREAADTAQPKTVPPQHTGTLYDRYMHVNTEKTPDEENRER